MTEQRDTNSPNLSLTDDAEPELGVHTVTSLRDLKRSQLRSVLHIDSDRTEQTDSDKGTPAHLIAVDLDVDHTGTSIYMRGQSVVDTPYPPIVLVHDICSHSTLYRTACKLFTDNNCSTYAFDLRGHGRSGRLLGHIPDFEVLVNDLLQVAAWVKHREDGRAPIIVAHGFGALIATHFHQKHKKFCAGLVLVAPTLKLRSPVSSLNSFFVSLVADISPTLRLPRSLIPRYFLPMKAPTKTSNVQIGNQMRLSAQFAKEINTALKTAPRKFLKVRVPSLVLVPEQDVVADISVIHDLVDRHKAREFLTVIKIEGSQHNMMSEQEVKLQTCIEKIVEWVKEKGTALTGANS